MSGPGWAEHFGNFSYATVGCQGLGDKRTCLVFVKGVVGFKLKMRAVTDGGCERRDDETVRSYEDDMAAESRAAESVQRDHAKLAMRVRSRHTKYWRELDAVVGA